MFQWWKKKRQERLNKLHKTLKLEILDLEEALDRQITLYELKTKQYNDFMVEAELRARRYNDLLQEEKENNGKLLEARLRQIAALKADNEKLSKTIKELSDNNDLLKHSLGTF